MTSVQPEDQTIVRAAIHPGIGIARIGDSKSSFYIGPEVTDPPPQGPDYYRDANGLKRQAARLGLTNVKFVGAVPDDDKIALLALCRGVVFPSHLRSEAFGITLLEGAMFGKPLISCEIGTGSSYVNIDGVTGIVTPPNDPAALRAAMRRLADDAALAEQMGRGARERFDTLFTADHMARSYVALYRKVLENR